MVQWNRDNGYKSSRGFNVLLCTLLLVSLFLLHFIGKSTLKSLESSTKKTNGIVDFFWVFSSLFYIFNIYMAVKLFLATCHPYRGPSTTIPACETVGVAAGVMYISSLILAVLHRKHITLPLPKFIIAIEKCFTNSKDLMPKIELLIKTFALWGIYHCVFTLCTFPSIDVDGQSTLLRFHHSDSVVCDVF